MQLERRGTFHSKQLASEVLDPEVLTVGFARRFATYKRATLVLRDPERLARIVNNAERPVQFIFAGKAHPRDHLGKELIRELIHMANREEFRRRIVFLEDYDIEVARVLVQGVDVWLNTPRRPLEASGTSGMKVPVNGGINLSVLDGWWCEGYNGSNGWVIGSGEEYEDHEYQDSVEALAVYDLLETEIAPTFYSRGAEGLPRDWIQLIKASMRELIPVFNTGRMVENYCASFYLPASRQWHVLSADGMSRVKELSRWKKKVREHWQDVKVGAVDADGTREFTVGDRMPVAVTIELGPLAPDDITVEAVAGALDGSGEIVGAQSWELEFHERPKPGVAVYRGEIECAHSGRNGFAIRALPSARRATASRFETRLVTWWGDAAPEIVHAGP
jgi:starch phosphorylase